MNRTANVSRSTGETQIDVSLDLDGGISDISTGIGFFDHMLNAFAHHGGFGLSLRAEGDLIVDCHHTIEDTGIVLGKVFKKALGDRAGIKRFGSAFIPMDEALGFCSVDICGRSYLVFKGDFPQERVGDFDTCMTEEFMRAFSDNSGITLHIHCNYGGNSHHMIEAMFKALAYAMKTATECVGVEILSTKGLLGDDREDENT